MQLLIPVGQSEPALSQSDTPSGNLAQGSPALPISTIHCHNQILNQFDRSGSSHPTRAADRQHTYQYLNAHTAGPQPAN